MTTQNPWPTASISPAEVDAIIRRARAERSKAMLAELAALPGLLKRLVANFRPIRQRTPQTNAVA